MKTIEDLSHEELIALNDDQIEQFIQIEIAQAGVRPCPIPIVPNLTDAGIVKDDMFYKVGDLLFKNKEDAIRVAAMDLYRTVYDWSIGYNYMWAEKLIDLQIVENPVYKQSDCLRVAPALQKQKGMKEDYEKSKSEYDKWLKSTSQYRDYVWGKIREAKTLEYEIQNAINAINQYKEISGGDIEIALNFFNKAFNDENQRVKELALARLGLK